MAYVVNVKPAYNNAVKVVSNDAMDGTILSNNLTPEVLLNIWNTYPQMRDYLYLQWVDIVGSYPAGTINASLLHAYDTSEVSHNPAKTDYATGSAGRHLNDVATIANATKNGLVVPSVLPTRIFDFAATKVLPADYTFTRNSTASYIDKYGTIRYAAINQPRFTHDPVSMQSLGLLIEESRTNYIWNSSDVTTSSYITKTTSQLAPDGSYTACLVTKNSSQNGNFDPVASVVTNGFYVRSLFAKANNTISSIIVFEGVGNTGVGGALIFNILTKTFSGDTVSAISYGYQDYPNGWVRIWVAVEKSDTKIVTAGFYLGGYSGTTAADNSTFVWGFQFEDGKALSSYIPTTSAIVTRGNDIVYINNSAIPKTEGTIVITGVVAGTWEKTNGNFRRVLACQFGLIGVENTSGIINSYDGQNSIQGGNTTYNDNIVLGYSNVKKITANGSAITSNTFNTSILSTGNVYVGSQAGISNFLNGTIKRITIYSKFLADPDLIALSTKGRLSSFEANGQTANSGLNEAAFLGVKTLMSLRNRQEFMVHGTGASESRNIRRPYDFTFEIVDSSGVTTVSAQPAASCTANTDNTLTLNAPVGKTLVYAITPVYDN